MEIFSTSFILFRILGYDVSALEFIGTIAGLLSVWFAARNNIITWPTGIVNVICFFFIFRATGLFSDMFLQVYYFLTCIYGWYYWRKSKTGKEVEITGMKPKFRWIILLITLVFTVTLGLLMRDIHELFPAAFQQPTAFPFADTFVAVASVIANTLMARKKIECWHMWILIDAIATFIYYQKGILLISGEFLIFTVLAVFGWLNWWRLMKTNVQG